MTSFCDIYSIKHHGLKLNSYLRNRTTMTTKIIMMTISATPATAPPIIAGVSLFCLPLVTALSVELEKTDDVVRVSSSDDVVLFSSDELVAEGGVLLRLVDCVVVDVVVVDVELVVVVVAVVVDVDVEVDVEDAVLEVS